MQRALRGLYCAIDPFCRAVLESNMARGRLPRAPVLDDVCDAASIVRTVGRRRVDLLIGTSSCKGFSVRGPRTGLKHAAAST